MRRRSRTPRIKYPTPTTMLCRARQFIDVVFTGMPEEISHITRVASTVTSLGTDFEIVALLHDILKQSGAGVAVIENAFTPTIAAAVDALTRQSEELYEDYLKRAKANTIARIVKIAEIEDALLQGALLNNNVEAIAMRPRQMNALQELMNQ